MEGVLKSGIIFCSIFMLVGILLIVIRMIYKNYNKEKKERCTVFAMGKVVDIKEDVSYVDGYKVNFYYPVFEYYVGEQKITVQSKVGKNSINFEVGQEVEIYYNPDDNEDYYVNDEIGYKRISRILLITGIIFIIMSIVVFILLFVFYQNFSNIFETFEIM